MANDNNKGLLHNLGNLAFKTRSYTPVPLALFMIWQAQVAWPDAWLGLALMAIGEYIRLASLRSSGKATRTRNVGASRLVTWGLYAHTRNPLYIGNILIMTGLFVMANTIYALITVPIVMFFYQAIVMAESSSMGERT